MTSILIMLGTGAEKVHGLKCLTVYVTWWGSCYCIELFNVQLLQTDPVGCVWSYQPFWVIRARMRCTFLATTYLRVLHIELFFLALYQWMTTWTDIQSESNLHAVWQTAPVQALCLFSVWPIHWTLVLSLSIQVKHDTTHYWHYWSDVKRLIVVLN